MDAIGLSMAFQTREKGENQMIRNEIMGKKQMVKVAFLCASLTALGGCAQYQMVNRYNPNANWNADLYQCNNEAAIRFPPAIVSSSSTQPNPYAALLNRQTTQTNCSTYGNQIDCTSTTRPNPYAVPSTTTTTTSTDVNKQNRDIFANQCLSARGWTRQLIKK